MVTTPFITTPAGCAVGTGISYPGLAVFFSCPQEKTRLNSCGCHTRSLSLFTTCGYHRILLVHSTVLCHRSVVATPISSSVTVAGWVYSGDYLTRASSEGIFRLWLPHLLTTVARAHAFAASDEYMERWVSYSASSYWHTLWLPQGLHILWPPHGCHILWLPHGITPIFLKKGLESVVATWVFLKFCGCHTWLPHLAATHFDSCISQT